MLADDFEPGPGKIVWHKTARNEQQDKSSSEEGSWPSHGDRHCSSEIVDIQMSALSPQ